VTTTQTTTPESRSKFPYSIVGVVVLFAILWRLDFPKPESDDLFYLGAGLNIARGGDLSNPLIARQEFPSHYFFVYPPLHSYALGGWLKFFGISAGSMTAYTIVNCLIITIATIIVLRRYGASVWLEWFTPLGVLFAFMPLGLRAEAISVALIMAGFALMDGIRISPNVWRQFVAFLLIFLGSSGAPRVTLYGAALAALLAFRYWRQEASPRLRMKMLIALAAAGIITTLVFLIMIDFRLGEFWHNFQYFAAGRVIKNRWHLILGFLLGFLGYIQISLPLVALAFLGYCIVKTKDGLSLPAVVIAVTLPVAICAGVIGSATSWWIFLVMLFAAGSALKTMPRKMAIGSLAVIFLMLAVINRKIAAETFGIVTGKIKNDYGDQYEAAKAIKVTDEHPVLLDGWVARYIYDYRLPKGSLDLASGTKFPGMTPGAYVVPGSTDPQLRKGDVFVVGYYMLHSLAVYTHLERPPPPNWYAFGIRQLKFWEYPRWVYIVTAEDCKSVKTEASVPLPGAQ
jgi:hypothetical protein